MKKIISSFLIVIIAMCSINVATPTKVNGQNTQWPSGPSLVATSAILIDASTGTILYSKKMDKKMYPASITKIMTALLTIENCKMDETVVFSDNAIHSLNYDDANIGCQVGEKMSVKECLYALMLSSANEVATALGEHISGSTKEFSKLMNERAKQAGAKHTHFENANGLHNVNHYVTAYDMAMIMRDSLKYPVFREIINSTEYTIKKNNKRKESFASYQRHKMVWETSGFYYNGVIGGKTGYTDQAGTTLVTSATRNGMTLITVVLHSNGNNVYHDTAALFDFGFNKFKSVNVSKNDSRFTDNSLPFKSPFTNSKKNIRLDEESNVVIPKNVNFSSLKTNVNFNQTNDSFATITYSLGDKTVGSAKLIYTNKNGIKESTKEPETTKVVKDKTETKKDKTSKSKKTSTKFKIKHSKTIITVLFVIILVISIIILIILQKKKMERIRRAKRNRERYY